MNKFFAMPALILVFSASTVAAYSLEKVVELAASTASEQAATAAGAAIKKKMVNVNTADAKALAKIPGIDSQVAEAITAYRKANGKFKTLQDLAKVQGVEPELLDAIKDLIRF
ncbi:MAG: hypothetical protein ACD_75C00174G0002 [uncultured bacterium]|nr:MAG: hypothetical protein ACD_75C00174G0002 [uncultured bacterium]